MAPPRALPTGILLAAGRGERFGGDKLLAPLRLPDGTESIVGVAALRNLLGAVREVLAVVRPDDDELARELAAAGARVVHCGRAQEGMGASLTAGVVSAGDTDGYVVALADMPWILPATHAYVAAALRDGAQIVAPYYNGVRGHPVGFAATLRDELLALSGDEGAKRVVAAHSDVLTRIDVDDPGIVRDVDIPADLTDRR